jgi:hypothetical protein
MIKDLTLAVFKNITNNNKNKTSNPTLPAMLLGNHYAYNRNF